MSKFVVIIGAGGHGKVIADIVLSAGDQVLGFLDDAPQETQFFGFPVLGRVADYRDFQAAEFVIGIGSAQVRENIAEKLEGVTWYTAIHPTAVVSPYGTTIGEGSVVMAGAVVNPGTKVGRHCIINTAASVDHDNCIEDFVHVSVGARLAGSVTVKAKSWVGIGAVISNNLTICEDCMIGAGAVVVKNISEAGTYAGVPAGRIK